MFTTSEANQVDLFTGVSSKLSARKLGYLENLDNWHNVFYRELTSKIDEAVFSKLYSKQLGRPNSPIRVMVGMLTLKEGYGWSDSELFEACRFHILVMRSLGLVNFDDDVPSESTYYDFKKMLLLEFNKGNDLMKACFKDVTSKQVLSQGVHGGKIRLDSKLINSNISIGSRLDLLLEAVKVFVRKADLSRMKGLLGEGEMELLETLKTKTVSNITFRLRRKDKKTVLIKLGQIMKALLTAFTNGESSYYALLEQIYKEHYEETEGGEDNEGEDTLKAKQGKDLSPKNIQSVHDPEAGYREKRGKPTQGYHSNITETCDPRNTINLVVDVQTESANVCEADFLLRAIKESEEVLKEGGAEEGDSGRIIEHASSDGGYHSNENMEAMEGEEMPHWNMGELKGRAHRYTISGDKETLKAYDLQLEKDCKIDYNPSRIYQYQILHEDGSKRKMKQEQVDNYHKIQRHKASLREEDRNIRPNVEATIFQVFHKLLKRDKIKYRGLGQCNNYVIFRALWVNIKRITKKSQAKTAFWAFFAMTFTLKLLGKKNVMTQYNFS